MGAAWIDFTDEMTASRTDSRSAYRADTGCGQEVPESWVSSNGLRRKRDFMGPG